MHVLDANELFGITSYTYDKIMEVWWKYWPDAFAMYFKLLKQARIQETNQTLTLNKFLMNYFGWWDDKVIRTKKILKDLWLIDDVIVRDELWKIKWHYVRVNYLIDEQKARNSCITYNLSTTTENQAVDSTRSGKVETNALSTKYINAWSTKKEIYTPSDEIYNLVDSFIDKGNKTIIYLVEQNKDYIKSQCQYIDKLLKKKYTIDEIKSVLEFIKNDEFWRKNILSIKKLLEKNKEWVPYFVVMLEKMKWNQKKQEKGFPLEKIKQVAVSYWTYKDRKPELAKEYEEILKKYNLLENWKRKEYANMVLWSWFIK